MFDFNNVNPISKPFPHIVCEDFLDMKVFNELKNSFPDDSIFKYGQVVMGGRKRIKNDNKAFYVFLDNTPIWKEFYNRINSKAFVQNVIELFADDILEYKPNFDPDNIRYDETYLKRISIDYPLQAKKISAENKIHSFKEVYSDELFMQLDISSANIGYSTGIHHDNDQKIASFIIYFSNSNQSDEGGEFVIHKHKEEKDFSEYERYPEDKDTVVIKKFKPIENLFLMFLSTKNSYHSVPLIKKSHGWRDFIYVGISIKNEKAWK